MRLKHKFTIVIAVTMVQVALLVFLILDSSKKMQEMKNYQYVRATVEGDLGKIVNTLITVDNWGFDIDTISDNYKKQIDIFTEHYDFVFEDEIIYKFSQKFRESLGEQGRNMVIIQTKLGNLRVNLNWLKDLKLTDDMKDIIRSDGARALGELYPDNHDVHVLMETIKAVHGQLGVINKAEIKLAKLNDEAALEITRCIEEQEKASLIYAIILTVISTIILIVLILLVTEGIVSRIKKIRDMTSVLASKNFAISIKPEGSTEMKSLMSNINNMVNQINDFFIIVKTTASKAISSGYKINDSANSTATATAEIDLSIDEINEEFEAITKAIQMTIEAISDMNDHVSVLVENNEKQTNSIEETNNAVNGAATTLEYISQMAKQRARSAEEMHSLVADGDSKINQTSSVLNDITGQLDKVREIVTIINRVTSKTNLLSMNAGIEAAHAGEAGKGFGVVATEIRGLAEETAKNAVLIEGVVNNIVESVSEANSSSAAASTAFIKVRNNADEIINSLHEITTGVGSIDNQMHQIKDKSEETACAADEINTYCTNLAIRQQEVSGQVDSMNELFLKTKKSIAKIKGKTADIVDRVTEVRDSSKDSYKNMTDLENMLEEFKTKSEVDEIVSKADEENTIENIVSENLKPFDNEERTAACDDELNEVLDNIENIEVAEDLEELEESVETEKEDVVGNQVSELAARAGVGDEPVVNQSEDSEKNVDESLNNSLNSDNSFDSEFFKTDISTDFNKPDQF